MIFKDVNNMETKLNIAEILKDKPKGTKLYSPLFGDVYLLGVDNNIIRIKYHEEIVIFFGDGRYYNYPESEPLLFPSKEMRGWSKFAWKKGDVLVNEDNVHIIFEYFENDDYTRFKGKHYFWEEGNEEDYSKEETKMLTSVFEKANDDNAQTYINIIERKLGGKLNLETLEIEKQPEFKYGDIALADYGNRQYMFIVSGKTDLSEGYNSLISLDLWDSTLNMGGYRMSFFKENLSKLRLATKEEKQQLFDALAKKGKAWDAEKKQIVDLKPKVELKPFDKVLVRDSKSDYWRANLFSNINNEGRYRCVSATWTYCIPYEGNESLLGTTKDVEG